MTRLIDTLRTQCIDVMLSERARQTGDSNCLRVDATCGWRQYNTVMLAVAVAQTEFLVVAVAFRSQQAATCYHCSHL